MDNSHTTIPDPVQRLLRDQLTSFERLAVVLLLHKRAPDELSADAIATLLQMKADLVGEALTGLAGGGLVEAGTQPQAWRFAAESHLTEAVSALSTAYCEQRAAVVGQMSVNAIGRIRSSPQITAGTLNVSAEQASYDGPDL